MAFLDIERRKEATHFDMSEPHSHEHYELYFLLEGSREVFLQDKMFVMPPYSFCVIPPFCLHKTEGDGYRRININVSADLLKKEEIKFLDECAAAGALLLDKTQCGLLVSLLEEAPSIRPIHGNLRKDYEFSVLKTLLYLLQKQRLTPLSEASATQGADTTDPLVLKLVFYLNENYKEEISLEKLAARFYLSKTTLCERFKALMRCSIMQYLLQIRLTKAKELLSSTGENMEKIAEECGFSSANYFSLIFKKEIGVSPLNYKKTR